ncbi:MAG: two-component regulator propeller domain-containing protein, partial [Saprospiraceae bacterium]
DSHGNIWFATFAGVIKYDGATFTNVTAGVSESRFFSILEDKKGNLWFGSIGEGVFLYDGAAWQHFTTNEGLVGNEVTNLYEDSKGNIWLGTTTGISIYDGTSFENLTKEQGLPYDDVNTIIEDETGVFWIGTRGVACTYDGKSFTTITNQQGDFFTNVRHIIKDKKGNIWLGGNSGLWRYDGENYIQLASGFTGYISEDKKGNIWTSMQSQHGQGWSLLRYEATTLDVDEPIFAMVKTGEGMFFGILEDSNGNIWVGNLNGVYRYDGSTFEDFRNKN